VPAQPRFAAPEAYTPKHLAEKILTSKAALEGERKQVTVLFVDVSGFTSLSERLDPEEVHRLMRRAFDLMLAEVHRYEGTVNQFLGDGIMALFGAPIAHEDHARRAVHAALGITRVLDEYRANSRRVASRSGRGRV
jgi:class 3 adenylate cyclase